MNKIEIIRGTNGKIKFASLDGAPIKTQTLIVEDSFDGVSKVTIIMEAIVTGRTE